MNFLKFGIFFTLPMAVVSVSAFEGDFERLTTSYGKVLEDVWVIEADDHGLTVRHQSGISKLGFWELSDNLRMLYEPIDDEVANSEGTEEIEEQAEVGFATSSVGISFRIYPSARVSSCWDPCKPLHWKPYWPKYHPAHSLVRPVCRAAVLQDFLYTAGLVPRPPGVKPHILPYNLPYLIR